MIGMNFASYVPLLLFVTIVVQLSNVEAECCCYPFCFFRPCVKYWNACNIFCCNCDGGCWPFSRSKHSYNSSDAWDQEERMKAYSRFKNIDINGDDAISYEEATSYLETTYPQKINISPEVRRMDINNDGIITPNEFDKSL